MFPRLCVVLLIGGAGILTHRAISSKVMPLAWTKRAIALAVPVNIDVSNISQVIYVNSSALGASDTNPGTSDQPLNTIGRALKLASTANGRGTGVDIRIGAGIYRESLTLAAAKSTTSAPIVIEADGTDPVVIAGSDVWTGWTASDNSTYSHSWPYHWGLAAYPNGWVGQVNLADIVRRREMIFVDGQPLKQVLNVADMADNTFCVREDLGTVYIRLSADHTPDQSMIEVAVRPAVLTISRMKNIVVRGLTFRHGNAAVQDGAVRITDCENVLIEKSSFIWNNWIGLDISGDANLTMRNSVANFNGGSGADGYHLTNVYWDTNDTSSNNWRGARGSFFGWSVAGAKFTSLHDGKFRGQTARDNSARGLWLDFDNTNILVDGSAFERNLNDGIFIEANQGPISISNSMVRGNQNGSGILGANSQDISVASCVLSGNSHSQVSISGDYDRTVTDWVTSASMNVRAQRWSLTGNQLIATDSTELLFDTPLWIPFLSTYQGSQNTWIRPADPNAFQVGPKTLVFSDWQQLVNSDSDSSFAVSQSSLGNQ